MSLVVKVLDSFDAVAKEEWSSLAASLNPFQQLSWYRSAPLPGRLRLLVAYRNQRPIALLPIYVVADSAYYYHNPRDLLCGFREVALFKALDEPVDILTRAAQDNWFPAAISVSPYGYRGGLIAVDDDEMEEVADCIASSVDDVCKREGVRLVCHYYLREGEDNKWMTALSRSGARIFLAGAHCVLDIKWQSLEDYFRAMGPRGRRLRASHMKQLLSTSVDWRMVGFRGGAIDHRIAITVIDLFKDAARMHGDRDPPVSLYNELLSNRVNDLFLLLGEKRDGSLQSALLVLKKDLVLYPKFYATAGAKDNYFFLTYSWLIDLATTLGVRHIDYGGGSHKAKLLRGAQLKWALAALRVYDNRLQQTLDLLIPVYESVKRAYFSRLVQNYGVKTSGGQSHLPRSSKEGSIA